MRAIRIRPLAWALLAIAAASLALRYPFPVLAFGGAGHDDALFVKLAQSLRSGGWLGSYDQLTLAKGAGYPLFIAFTASLAIPLKLAEHVAYLAACLGFALVAGSIVRSRAAVVALFAVLTLNPLFWSGDIGGRVVRENLYVSLSLALLALALHVFAGKSGAARSRPPAAAPVWLGVTGGLFWITREEGLWLLPSLLVIVAAWALRELFGNPQGSGIVGRVRAMALVLAVPVAAFAVVVGIVNTLNFVRYGVFINNEFRARHFPAAYGALSRIRHDDWRPYVVFPRDARERAYSVSPAAASLAPVLDGARGEFWRKVGCEQTGTEPCPEILSGWFMWVVREAAASAGHDGSAVEMRAFFRRLAREVNEACDAGRIPCGPRNDSLVPPWRPEYLPRLLAASDAVMTSLMTLGRLQPSMGASTGTPDQLRAFQRMTRGPLAWAGDEKPPGWPVAAAVSRLQSRLLELALPTSVIASLALIGVSLVRRRWHPGHVVSAALVVAIAMRVALLGFLEATSIPSNNLLYLLPVTPVALALPIFVAFLAFDLYRDDPEVSDASA